MLAHDGRVQPPTQPRLAARLRLGARLQLPLELDDDHLHQVLVHRPHDRRLEEVGRERGGAQQHGRIFFAFLGSMRVKVEGPRRVKW